jgi:glycine cleavage system H protein
MSTNIPAELKYTSDHEWGKIEDNILTVGITDFAQSSLGDIVFVELPDVGTTVDKGGAFGVVESIKSVSDLYSPVTGEIIEKNDELESSPELCNSDAYGSWMIKIKISNPGELEELMDSGKYAEFCQTSH